MWLASFWWGTTAGVPRSPGTKRPAPARCGVPAVRGDERRTDGDQGQRDHGGQADTGTGEGQPAARGVRRAAPAEGRAATTQGGASTSAATSAATPAECATAAGEGTGG
ncbi:MAG: hypothetical protein WCD35_15725, partial [Mycobacteriales bacterium]